MMLLIYLIWCAASGSLAGKITPDKYFWPVIVMVGCVNSFIGYFLDRVGVI